MEPAERVALLSLVYLTLGARATCADDASPLLVKMATESLGDLDALIVDTMGSLEELSELAVALADFDALRYEALLHAWPPGSEDGDGPPDGLPWQQYSGERWAEVEALMDRLRALGITASRDFVDAVAEEAYAAGLAQVVAAD